MNQNQQLSKNKNKKWELSNTGIDLVYADLTFSKEEPIGHMGRQMAVLTKIKELVLTLQTWLLKNQRTRQKAYIEILSLWPFTHHSSTTFKTWNWSLSYSEFFKHTEPELDSH